MNRTPQTGCGRRTVAGSAAVWVTGAHGDPVKAASLTSSTARGSPVTAGLSLEDGTKPRVLPGLPCRHAGLTAAHSALTQWVSGAAPAPVDLLGLAVLADAPGKTPKPFGTSPPSSAGEPPVLDPALGRSLAAP